MEDNSDLNLEQIEKDLQEIKEDMKILKRYDLLVEKLNKNRR